MLLCFWVQHCAITQQPVQELSLLPAASCVAVTHTLCCENPQCVVVVVSQKVLEREGSQLDVITNQA